MTMQQTLDVAKAHRLEILRARSLGKTIKEIALDLDLSEKTIEYHWGQACREIGVPTRDVALVTRWVIANLETQKETGNRHD